MKIITDGAKTKCTLGTKTSSLVVTSQQFSKIENKLIATEGDNKSLSNILSFGNCKRSSHQPTCIPSPTEWTSLTETNKINNKRQLTEKAFCNCSQGGKIEFIDTGANSHVDSE